MSEKTIAITEHPLYTEWKNTWRVHWDFYRGGRWALQPASGSVSYLDVPLVTRTKDAPAHIALLRSISEWTATGRTSSLRSYLFAHPRESEASYRNRVAQSVWPGIARGLIDVYAAHVSEQECHDHEVVTAEPIYSRVWADMTGTGTSRATFWREAMAYADVFGACFLVGSMPEQGDIRTIRASGELTRADELAANVRPYLMHVTPLQAPFWVVDRFGRFEAFAYEEEYPIAATFGAPPPEHLRRYRLLTLDQISVYEQTEAKSDRYRLISETPNPYRTVRDGVVVPSIPVVTVFAQDCGTSIDPVGEGLMHALADHERDLFNRESERTAWLRDSAFTQLCVDADLTANAEIPVGNSYAIPMAPGQPEPKLLESSGKPYEVLSDAIAQIAQRMRVLAAQTRGMAELSKSARSGEALAYETRSEAAMLRARIAQRERAEREVAGLIWDLWRPGVGRPEGLTGMTVACDFDERELSAELEEITAAFALSAMPEAAKRAVAEHVAGELVSRYVPDDQRAAVMAEIKAEMAGLRAAPSAFRFMNGDGTPLSGESVGGIRSNLPRRSIP